MNIKAAWTKGNLIIGDPIPVDLPDILPLSGKARAFLNGSQFATISLVQTTDASPESTYLPVWYVMQALNQMGQPNHWNGHQWTLGHLFA